MRTSHPWVFLRRIGLLWALFAVGSSLMTAAPPSSWGSEAQLESQPAPPSVEEILSAVEQPFAEKPKREAEPAMP